MAQEIYNVKVQVAQPVISVPAGKYDTVQKVTVTCATEGAVIYYTTDGSTPSESNGTMYTGEITISESCILRVIAVKEGIDDSRVTAANYKIELSNETGEETSGNDNTNGTASAGSDTQSATSGDDKGCASGIESVYAVLAILALVGVCCIKRKINRKESL